MLFTVMRSTTPPLGIKCCNSYSGRVLQSNPGSVPPAPVPEAAMAKEDVTVKGRKREREPAGKPAAGNPPLLSSPPENRVSYCHLILFVQRSC